MPKIASQHTHTQQTNNRLLPVNKVTHGMHERMNERTNVIYQTESGGCWKENKTKLYAWNGSVKHKACTIQPLKQLK